MRSLRISGCRAGFRRTRRRSMCRTPEIRLPFRASSRPIRCTRLTWFRRTRLRTTTARTSGPMWTELIGTRPRTSRRTPTTMGAHGIWARATRSTSIRRESTLQREHGVSLLQLERWRRAVAYHLFSAGNQHRLHCDRYSAVCADYELQLPAVRRYGDHHPSSTEDGFYPWGTALTYTATPGTGWTFAGWTYDLSGTASPTTFDRDERDSGLCQLQLNQHAADTDRAEPVGSGRRSVYPLYVDAHRNGLQFRFRCRGQHVPHDHVL